MSPPCPVLAVMIAFAALTLRVFLWVILAAILAPRSLSVVSWLLATFFLLAWTDIFVFSSTDCAFCSPFLTSLRQQISGLLQPFDST